MLRIYERRCRRREMEIKHIIMEIALVCGIIGLIATIVWIIADLARKDKRKEKIVRKAVANISGQSPNETLGAKASAQMTEVLPAGIHSSFHSGISSLQDLETEGLGNTASVQPAQGIDERTEKLRTQKTDIAEGFEKTEAMEEITEAMEETMGLVEETIGLQEETTGLMEETMGLQEETLVKATDMDNIGDSEKTTALDFEKTSALDETGKTAAIDEIEKTSVLEEAETTSALNETKTTKALDEVTPRKVKFCINCGAQLKGSGRFCIKCGFKNN